MGSKPSISVIETNNDFITFLEKYKTHKRGTLHGNDKFMLLINNKNYETPIEQIKALKCVPRPILMPLNKNLGSSWISFHSIDRLPDSLCIYSLSQESVEDEFNSITYIIEYQILYEYSTKNIMIVKSWKPDADYTLTVNKYDDKYNLIAFVMRNFEEIKPLKLYLY